MAYKIDIQNIVASINLETEIPLGKLLAKLKGSEYEPEQFPGLVYRIEEPRAAMLIFSSGKIVCTGARSLTDVESLFRMITKSLKRLGIKVPPKYKMQIENIVASTKLGNELNLNKIVMNIPTAEYEPEQFPGLVLRLDMPKVVCLLFASGKVICTGAHSLADVRKAVNLIAAQVKKLKAVK
jgi:transcription initiation factor TFIID TATA-box-binding protein